MKINTSYSTEIDINTEPERKKVFIHAGQLHAAMIPTEIVTILGSCVAVCLWDPILRAGGMNHYLLPIPFSTYEISSNAMKFGETSIRKLIEKVVDVGCKKSRLAAKVFGGASVTQEFQHGPGSQNISVALRCLEAEGIPVLATDAGGKAGRKLIYHTDTGIAWVRQF